MRIAHRVGSFSRLLRAIVAAAGVGYCGQSLAATCSAERDAPLVPKDPALCANLLEAVRKPAALPLNEYKAKLAAFLRNFCHRDRASGWKRDKRMRDTGPFIGIFKDGKWEGSYQGTHFAGPGQAGARSAAPPAPRLVLGLVRLEGGQLGSELAGASRQRLSEHGFRPLLHQLP